MNKDTVCAPLQRLYGLPSNGCEGASLVPASMQRWMAARAQLLLQSECSGLDSDTHNRFVDEGTLDEPELRLDTLAARLRLGSDREE